MKTAFLTISFIILSLPLYAQLSDDQVIGLIRQSHEQGLKESEIAASLMQRGVTQEQLLRIRNKVGPAASSSASTGRNIQNRFRSNPKELRQRADQQPKQDTVPPEDDRRPDDRRPENRIFGHNVFNNKQLTFEPSLNIATPENYLLGPGDEVIIDIWGESEQTIRQTISPDGTIVIPQLGPIQLNGFSIREADARLRRSLSRIYSSMGGARPGTFVKLSLGQIRSIQVHVMGEVVNPGTYTVSSLASLFHVLYNAGGVNAIGSLRDIAVSRGGRHIATIDVYAYLLEGKTDADVALKDGDVVRVSPYRNLVDIAGSVKRPMKYEMKDAETLASLIGFSGGFAGGSYRDAVTVVRRSGRLQEVHNVGRGEYDRFPLLDGDSIVVAGIIDRFANKIEISGAVFRPGLYAVSDSVSTVARLIGRADGLRGDAFAGRAILMREKPDYTFEALSVDVGAILSGAAPDIALHNNDRLHIQSISDMREEYTVTVQGAVRTPGEYVYADNLSIEDMIVMAGGLLESASTARVDVFRRVKNQSSVTESDRRSESFTFPIRDGLVVPSGDVFTLMPFDIVTVRTSPGYEIQKAVTVYGEVLFPGDYTLVKREERLSDLLKKAGGALSSAYLRGASLIRKKDSNEETRTRSTHKLTQLGGPDSLSLGSLNLASTYSVGIELEKALSRPGSDCDLVLKEGDVLHVPGYLGTVTISGAVLYPNTVAYSEGISMNDYIEQAGGYADRARRRAKIIIHMNGTISRVKTLRKASITPGCEIVVPYRSYRAGGRMSVAEVLSLGASTISSASMVTSIINSLK